MTSVDNVMLYKLSYEADCMGVNYDSKNFCFSVSYK